VQATRISLPRCVCVPDAQGGLPAGPRVLYVLGTRTGLGRIVRTAYRGTPGDQPAGFASLGRKMALPETTALALRAPLPLPAGLPGEGEGEGEG